MSKFKKTISDFDLKKVIFIEELVAKSKELTLAFRNSSMRPLGKEPKRGGPCSSLEMH